MKLAWAMLANAAEVREGLAFIIAGGIDTVFAPALPARFFGSIILRLTYRPAELGMHRVTFVVIDEDGGQVGRIEGELEVGLVAGVPSSWDHGAVFAITLNGLPLPRHGVYRIDIMVDGRAEGELNLRVAKPPAPNRAQRRKQSR